MHNEKPNHCRECGKRLTDPASIAQGTGPECAGKALATLTLVSAGRNAEAFGLGDYQLTRRGSRLLQLQRISMRYADGAPLQLQRDLRQAEKHYAARVALLSKQGFITVEVDI